MTNALLFFLLVILGPLRCESTMATNPTQIQRRRNEKTPVVNMSSTTHTGTGGACTDGGCTGDGGSGSMASVCYRVKWVRSFKLVFLCQLSFIHAADYSESDLAENKCQATFARLAIGTRVFAVDFSRRYENHQSVLSNNTAERKTTKPLFICVKMPKR
jgi:hypothetical protein